jgi:hypothetical protein
MISALIAGQVALAAQPAAATGLVAGDEREVGAFAGLSLRVPLDGHAGERRPQLGLAFAPTVRTQNLQGAARTRIDQGVELGFTGDQRVRLSLAGTPVSRLAQGREGPDGRRLGVSSLGWMAIGVGDVAVGAAAWFYFTITDEDRCCE